MAEPYHLYGYRKNANYFGFNLFCEIDNPGEWYLDRDTGLLYWYPPVNIDPQKAEVTFTYFSSPYMLEISDCSNMTVDGLSFKEGRGSAIAIHGGDNNRIMNCRIERFGQDGIHIYDGENHGVSGCALFGFGYGGIKVRGGDRKTLTPSGHFIEHTTIDYFSLFKHTYEPAVHVDGCGIRLSNNRFRHSTSSAMRLEGNDHLIEYNQISHVVDESDDQGALDMWYNPSYRGNIIRYNHWSDISGGSLHGAAAIRLDDMISGTFIYGNLFERCGVLDFGAVQIHGGKDNMIENNIFYNCHAAVSFSPWNKERWLSELNSQAIHTRIYEEVDIRSEIYQKQYPELKSLHENENRNIINNNLIIHCKKTFLRDDMKQIKENNTVHDEAIHPIQYYCTPSVLEKYGLTPIPFDAIGPKNNRW